MGNVVSEKTSPVDPSPDVEGVHFETVDETIARIKRDVMVTGSILSFPGQESAFFKIEGLPDQQFKINTQLMDGFIIRKIAPHEVVLKNQVGEETFSLYY